MSGASRARRFSEWELICIKDCIDKGYSLEQMHQLMPHRRIQSIYCAAKKLGYVSLHKRRALAKGGPSKPTRARPNLRRGGVYEARLYWIRNGFPVDNEEPATLRYIRRSNGKNPLNIFEVVNEGWRIALTDYEVIEALKSGAMAKR